MANNINENIDQDIWEEEINRIKRKRAKRFKKTLTILVVTVWTLVVFVFGYALNLLDRAPLGEANISKFEQIKKILEEEWYFAEGIENIDQALIDQALYGMSENELDPYTTYMSNDEKESFQTSINKGFVGIGVQYIGGENLNVITKVFKDSPAQKAGVQVGDIINKVDNVPITDLNVDEIADRVKGESGTIVTIEFIRGDELVELEIIRGAVDNNTYGYALDESTGYVQLFSFGNSTASELEKHMLDFKANGIDQLIIDVRDNGGGYLDSLVDVASLFMDKGTVAMVEEYADGSTDVWKTGSGKIDGFNEIIIMINGNSASASEVFALAMKENLSNVTLVGETSFGKGTVQNTRVFMDGSALKYTAGRWLSPNGVWVHGEGIKPDVEVKTPNIMNMPLFKMDGLPTIKMDEVSSFVVIAQEALIFLGYDDVRNDGYLDVSTYKALEDFKKEHSIEAEEGLSIELYNALISVSQKEWATNIEKDPQLIKAWEMINE